MRLCSYSITGMNSLFSPRNSRLNTADQLQSFSHSRHLHFPHYCKLCIHPHPSHLIAPHQSKRAFLQQIILLVNRFYKKDEESNYSPKKPWASSYRHIVIYSLCQGKVPKATLNCWTHRWQWHWPQCSPLWIARSAVTSGLQLPSNKHLPLWHEMSPKRCWALLHEHFSKDWAGRQPHGAPCYLLSVYRFPQTLV